MGEVAPSEQNPGCYKYPTRHGTLHLTLPQVLQLKISLILKQGSLFIGNLWLVSFLLCLFISEGCIQFSWAITHLAIHTAIKGQPALVSPLLLPCESQEWNSSHQPWQQTHLPTESSPSSVPLWLILHYNFWKWKDVRFHWPPAVNWCTKLLLLWCFSPPVRPQSQLFLVASYVIRPQTHLSSRKELIHAS